MVGEGPQTRAEFDAWYDALSAITALATARVHGIEVDEAQLWAEHDPALTARVLLKLTMRIVTSFGQESAVETCREWGLIATARGAGYVQE